MVNALSTMTEVLADVGKPVLKQDAIAKGEVTGFMSMVTPQLRASLNISFSKFVILDIVRRMLGKEITEAGVFS